MWKESRDCAMASTCSSSQTQRSLCDSISTIWTRVSSESAWNQLATRAGSGRVAAVMISTYQVFLIRQGGGLAAGQGTGPPMRGGHHRAQEGAHEVEGFLL